MKYIIANWKMNPASIAEAKEIVKNIKIEEGVYLGIAAPFVYFSSLKETMKGKAELWAQDVFYEPKGAFTGAVSVAMIEDAGAKGVIVGHSERRQYFKETDAIINKKLKAALNAGLKAVLCIGEKHRRLGKTAMFYAKKAVLKQIKSCLRGLNKETFKNLIVAYEPVWAISTTKNARPCSPETAEEMIDFIRAALKKNYGLEKPLVIYGGSVNPENAAGFLTKKVIDGCLPGAASLNSEALNNIIKSAALGGN